MVVIEDRGTRFADMGDGIAAQALAWARSHDWGQDASYDADGRMIGLTDVSHSLTGGWSEQAATAATLGGLRDWAGY